MSMGKMARVLDTTRMQEAMGLWSTTPAGISLLGVRNSDWSSTPVNLQNTEGIHQLVCVYRIPQNTTSMITHTTDRAHAHHKERESKIQTKHFRSQRCPTEIWKNVCVYVYRSSACCSFHGQFWSQVYCWPWPDGSSKPNRNTHS